MPSGCRLIVRLRDRWGERTLSLDFADRALLDGQLDAFRRVRAKAHDPFLVHEFQNGRGESIAFTDKVYTGHSVEERP